MVDFGGCLMSEYFVYPSKQNGRPMFSGKTNGWDESEEMYVRESSAIKFQCEPLVQKASGNCFNLDSLCSQVGASWLFAHLFSRWLLFVFIWLSSFSSAFSFRSWARLFGVEDELASWDETGWAVPPAQSEPDCRKEKRMCKNDDGFQFSCGTSTCWCLYVPHPARVITRTLAFLGGSPQAESTYQQQRSKCIEMWEFQVPSITQSQDALAQESSRANHPVRPQACTCQEPQCLKVFKSGSLPMPTPTPPTPLTLPPRATRRRRRRRRRRRIEEDKWKEKKRKEKERKEKKECTLISLAGSLKAHMISKGASVALQHFQRYTKISLNSPAWTASEFTMCENKCNCSAHLGYRSTNWLLLLGSPTHQRLAYKPELTLVWLSHLHAFVPLSIQVE